MSGQQSGQQPAQRSWLEVRWRQFKNPPQPVFRAVTVNLVVAILGGLLLLLAAIAQALLTLLGVFQAALGAARRREVVLWQRVDFPERLPALFTRELPAHVKGPGTWMHDALEVRDDWESRLLRSASWSPLG